MGELKRRGAKPPQRAKAPLSQSVVYKIASYTRVLQDKYTRVGLVNSVNRPGVFELRNLQ